MLTDFSSVTEVSGDDVSLEQVERLCHRYYWAGSYCKDKEVIEVACGTGQGLGYLLTVSKSLEAGDYFQPMVDKANEYYKNRVSIRQFDAIAMPFDDESKDIIILFEAIYYLPNVIKFVTECSRVLKKNGYILIATANKDLYDFNPSPYSYDYYGAVELFKLFEENDYSCELFSYFPISEGTLRQKILRPIKKLIVSLGLMPKSMKGKKLLKRLVFGDLIAMPFEITENMFPYESPALVANGGIEPDMMNKVLYCAARKK